MINRTDIMNLEYNINKKPRKNIPKIIRDKVWDNNIGLQNGTGKCYCCNDQIDSKNFEAGHIVSVADGGETIIDNLRPICSKCNRSMGTDNMINFIQKCSPSWMVTQNRGEGYLLQKTCKIRSLGTQY